MLRGVACGVLVCAAVLTSCGKKESAEAPQPGAPEAPAVEHDPADVAVVDLDLHAGLAVGDAHR